MNNVLSYTAQGIQSRLGDLTKHRWPHVRKLFLNSPYEVIASAVDSISYSPWHSVSYFRCSIRHPNNSPFSKIYFFSGARPPQNIGVHRVRFQHLFYCPTIYTYFTDTPNIFVFFFLNLFVHTTANVHEQVSLWSPNAARQPAGLARGQCRSIVDKLSETTKNDNAVFVHWLEIHRSPPWRTNHNCRSIIPFLNKGKGTMVKSNERTK